MKGPDEKYCTECGQVIKVKAVICPKCGCSQAAAFPAQAGASSTNNNKLAAGLLGIMIGAFGAHKFVLGYNTAGIIMLLTTILTCGFGAIVMHPIGLIEGIIYLTKSDEEFHEIYEVGQRTWF
jgi:TM2 domain-containing membrane protein YozV